MVIYLIPIVVLGLLSIKDLRYNNNKVYGMFFLFFTIVSAIRYDIGTDYSIYYGFYNLNIRGLSENLVGTAFYYVARLVNFLGGDYTWIIAASAIFLAYSVNKIFSYFFNDVTLNLYFAFFIYLTCGMYFSSYNIFRQYTATSFFMLAVIFFLEKKYIRSFIMFFVAILFHSAIIFGIILLLIYQLFKNKNMFYFLIMIYIFSLLLMVIDIQKLITFFSFFIPTKYVSYLNNNDAFLTQNNLAIVKLIVPNITWIWIMGRFNIIVESLYKGKEIIIGFTLYLFFCNSFFGVMVLTRISEFFFIFVPLATTYLVESYDKVTHRRIITITFVSYYFLLTFVTIFLMNGNGVVPYQSIFEFF